MKKVLVGFMLLIVLAIPVSASEMTAPPPPNSAQEYLPEVTGDFSEDLWYVIQLAIRSLSPDLGDSIRVCATLLGTALILSLIKAYDAVTENALEPYVAMRNAYLSQRMKRMEKLRAAVAQ